MSGYEEYLRVLGAVKPVVLALAPELKRYGFTADDCLQEAALKVWMVMHAVPDNGRGTIYSGDEYLKQCVRNHLRKRAEYAGHHTVCEVGEPTPAAHPPANDQFIRGWTKTEWNDALLELQRERGGVVATYVLLRVEEGYTWDQLRKALNCSGETLIALREEAGEWLMAQLEGRRTKSG